MFGKGFLSDFGKQFEEWNKVVTGCKSVDEIYGRKRVQFYRVVEIRIYGRKRAKLNREVNITVNLSPSFSSVRTNLIIASAVALEVGGRKAFIIQFILP